MPTDLPENRTAIFEHALRLFSERGYDAVSVQELCDSASITKPTLYHYFGSKSGLLATLVKELSAGLLERFAASAEYRRDIVWSLERMANALFEEAKLRPHWYRFILSQSFAPVDSEGARAILPCTKALHDTCVEFFLKAERDHGNMRGKSVQYAITFLGMVHTWIGMGLAGHVELNDDLMRRGVKQFMHGLF